MPSSSQPDATTAANGGGGALRVIGTAAWVYVAVGVADLLFTLGAVLFYVHQGPGVGFVVFVLLATLAGLGMAEAVFSRIVLGETALEVLSLRSRGHYPASEIRSVRWEGGSGVALQLATGRWVKLPEMGRNAQSVANTIRAWLEKATSGTGS
jgi:hypothetical protein